ncbi:MFS transporter [Streptomyces caniscabiei]|uniref:MFS transporter n=1 Tax=Streptomyces caniscabiei TaxID=2746961 RepID=UPI001F3AF727|nr:MFS transporter [Streptomyces caniscabiei]
MAALIVLALLWPTQLLTLISMVGGSAQPQIAIHFHTTQIIWFTLATGVVGTLITPFVIKAGDIFGRRNTMIAITLFGLIGDVIAALAPNFGVLIAGRAISGIYAPISVLAYTAIREIFPPKQAAVATSVVASGVGVVAIGGPFLAGWVIDDYGYRGALWSLVAATAIGLLLLLLFMPRTPRVRGVEVHMDWIGGLLLGGGIAILGYGLGNGATWGWLSAKTLAFLLGGVVCLVAFLVSQKLVARPMVPLAMLARRPVWSVFLATAVSAGVLGATGVVGALQVLYPKIPGVSDGLGFSVTYNAVIGLPSNILLLAAGFGTGLLVRKIDSRLLLRIGLVLTATGYLLQANYHYTALQTLLVSIPFAVGYGLVISTVYVLVMQVVAPEEQGVANMVQGLMVGIVVAVALAVSYALLGRHGTVLEGTEFYLDQGYTDFFYFAAGLVVLALLTTFLIPRLKPAEQIEAGPAITE